MWYFSVSFNPVIYKKHKLLYPLIVMERKRLLFKEMQRNNAHTNFWSHCLAGLMNSILAAHVQSNTFFVMKESISHLSRYHHCGIRNELGESYFYPLWILHYCSLPSYLRAFFASQKHNFSIKTEIFKNFNQKIN